MRYKAGEENICKCTKWYSDKYFPKPAEVGR